MSLWTGVQEPAKEGKVVILLILIKSAYHVCERQVCVLFPFCNRGRGRDASTALKAGFVILQRKVLLQQLRFQMKFTFFDLGEGR